MSTRRNILVLLVAGFLVRELFAPWTGHPWDLEVFARVGYYVANGTNPYVLLNPVGGITFAPYGVMTSVGYPPLWPLICGAIYSAYAAISQFFASPSLVYFALLKQPAIFGDLLCAVVASKLVGGKVSKKVLLFWLFNPLIIILSSVWGMFDSLVVLLVLLSLMLLLRERPLASGGALGLGTVLKLVPVIYAPILLLVSREKAKFALLFAASVAVFIIGPFILLGWSPVGFLFSMASQAVNIRDAPAVGGLTIFSVFEVVNMAFPDRVPSLLLTALSFLWIPALGIFYLRLYWPLLKGAVKGLGNKASLGAQRFSIREAVRLLIIASLIFLLTRPWVSEGTVLYPVALMLIDVTLFHSERKRLFTAIWVLALLFLVTNNTLLIRFVSPISSAALPLDLAINNGAFTGPIRLAIKLLLSFSFYFAIIRALQVYGRKDNGQAGSQYPASGRVLDLRQKRITVGICAHNEQENIGRLLDSLKGEELGTDAKLLEVIVVSSGSTDGTNSIVTGRSASFREASLITEPERTGKSNAQNIILSQAKGNVIVMISADSMMRPGALGRLVGTLDGDVGAAKARAVPLNEEGGIANFASRFVWELLHQTNLYLGSRGGINSLGGDMIALKAGIVDAIPENVVNDDAYLGTVVRANGFQIAYVPDAVLYIRGPSTVGDFLRQRSRVLYGHQQLATLFRVKPSVFENIMLSDPVNAARIFIKTCSGFSPRQLLKVPFVLALELIAQFRSRIDKKRNYILWDMVATSKKKIPDDRLGLVP